MRLITSEQALHDLEDHAAREGVIKAGVPYYTARLQAAVAGESVKSQEKSMAALEAAMRAFTKASDEGSKALTEASRQGSEELGKATHRLVIATWVLAGVAAVQALAMIFGGPQ